MSVPEAPFEQHMIRDMAGYERLLQSLELEGRTIVEFGVGTGALTRAILKQSPGRLIGYEIDESMVPADLLCHPALDMRFADFTSEDFGFLNDSRYAFISNPPYSELPFIKDLIARYPPEILVMMVSEKKQGIYFPGERIALRFGPEDFSPPARGNHVVIVRGNGCRA